VNIRRQEKRLRRTKYGGIDDWVLLYYVWDSEGGRIEHDARRLLSRFRQLRMAAMPVAIDYSFDVLASVKREISLSMRG
jgi:hypothetical protein